MIKMAKQACRLTPFICDYPIGQGTENFAEQPIGDKGDGTEFFSRNVVIQSADLLSRERLPHLHPARRYQKYGDRQYPVGTLDHRLSATAEGHRVGGDRGSWASNVRDAVEVLGPRLKNLRFGE